MIYIKSTYFTFYIISIPAHKNQLAVTRILIYLPFIGRGITKNKAEKTIIPIVIEPELKSVERTH